MEDFKLKLIITGLGGVVFSFIFIVLAFALPTKEATKYYKKPSNKLGEVSKSMRNR